MPAQQGVGLNDEERCFPRAQLAGQEYKRVVLSRQERAGRFGWRLRMIICWRRKAFSRIRSNLERVTSAATEDVRDLLSGLVQLRSRRRRG
jgi:hypothetical protein